MVFVGSTVTIGEDVGWSVFLDYHFHCISDSGGVGCVSAGSHLCSLQMSPKDVGVVFLCLGRLHQQIADKIESTEGKVVAQGTGKRRGSV